jgi:hypothetical protein
VKSGFFGIMILYLVQSISSQEFEENKFDCYDQRWKNADRGILLNQSEKTDEHHTEYAFIFL